MMGMVGGVTICGGEINFGEGIDRVFVDQAAVILEEADDVL